MARAAPSIAPNVLEATEPQACTHPQRTRVWVGAIGVAIAIAHSCGYAFGVANQVTYFIEPLRRAHPELFQQDWFATQTTMYHSVFAATASYLFRIEDSGVIGCAIAHAVLMTALVTGVFVVVKGASSRGAFAVFVIVAAWLTINGDRSMAGSYLWSGYLQPSLIATVAWVFALAAFARSRPFVAGLALAAGGVFHVNFLVLGIGMFSLAELVANGWNAKRFAWLLAPQLAALAALAPELVTSASSTDPDLALWVLARFHAPGHYYPWTVAHTLPVLVRWVALAIVVAPVATAYGCRGPVRRLVSWCWIAGAICALAVPVLMMPQLASLTRLYVWRLAPFAQLVAMIVIAIAAVATIDDPARWLEQAPWRRWTAVGLAAYSVWLVPSETAAIGGWAPAAVAVGIAVAILVPYLRATLPIAVAVASLVVVIDGRWSTFAHPHVAVASGGFETDDLYDWARTSTPVDTRFLTPPSLAGFRLHARRAIVVDLKSPPLVPDEIVEWYRRLCSVTGDPRLANVPEANRRWNESTEAQLLVRARQLGAQYLVLDRPHDEALLQRSVYANERYVVLATPR
ncbi:MAG: DUF6798 domain-containing protein [Kofleriaceae bacterium]